MSEAVEHTDNDTPDATDDDIKRMDADTPGAPAGAAVADQGVGQAPTDSTDTDRERRSEERRHPGHAAPGAGERGDDDAVDNAEPARRPERLDPGPAAGVSPFESDPPSSRRIRVDPHSAIGGFQRASPLGAPPIDP